MRSLITTEGRNCVTNCQTECTATDVDANPIPIVCTPEAIPADRRAEHRERLVNVILAKALSSQASAEGFILAYRAEDFLELAKWINLERLCCPFANFALCAGRDVVELRITGPEGTADYLLSLISSR